MGVDCVRVHIVLLARGEVRKVEGSLGRESGLSKAGSYVYVLLLCVMFATIIPLFCLHPFDRIGTAEDSISN